jgi:hypothetical protein
MTYKPVNKIPCVICSKDSIGRKLCKTCYYKIRALNRLHEFPLLGPNDVFMERINKTDSCWLWTGTKNTYGYGIFLLPGEVQVRAHRHSYEIHNGPIPEGMVIMHSCDNPPCVNPDHLKIGTRLENNRDSVKKRRNAYGSRNGQSKLSEEQISLIRADNRTHKLIADEFNISQSHVSRVRAMKQRTKG